MQRAQVTLMLSEGTVSEKGGKTTLTATQDREANLDTVLTVSVDSESVGILSDNTTLTIPAGSKASTGEVTITAVDNDDIADSATSTDRVGDSGPRRQRREQPRRRRDADDHRRRLPTSPTWSRTSRSGPRRPSRSSPGTPSTVPTATPSSGLRTWLARPGQLEPLQLPGRVRHVDHRPAAGPR